MPPNNKYNVKITIPIIYELINNNKLSVLLVKYLNKNILENIVIKNIINIKKEFIELSLNLLVSVFIG